MFFRISTLAMAALTLAGCGNLNSVYRDDSLVTPGGHIITLDGKQRAILSSRVRKKDNYGRVTQVYRRYCSEPAPDAFSALSMGTSGDAALSGENETPEARARLAIAMSEAASSFERTQTVNVLREAMFNTCQRYLNGSIDETELMIQAARDQRMMVSVLAIEQLTRTVRPQATVLVGGAAGAVYNDPDKVQQWYTAQQKKVEDLRVEFEKAKTEFAVHKEVDKGKCEKAYHDDATHKDEKPSWEKCVSLQTAANNAEQKVQGAEAELANLSSMRERSVAGMTATAGGGATGIPGKSEQMASNESLAEVAGTVQKIVEKTFEFDEFQMSCVARLRQIRPTLLKSAEDPNIYLFNTSTGGSKIKASDEAAMKEAQSIVDASKELDSKCMSYIEDTRGMRAARMALQDLKDEEEALAIQVNAVKEYLAPDIAGKWKSLRDGLGTGGLELSEAPPQTLDAAAAAFRRVTSPVRTKAYRFIRRGEKAA